MGKTLQQMLIRLFLGEVHLLTGGSRTGAILSNLTKKSDEHTTGANLFDSTEITTNYSRGMSENAHAHLTDDLKLRGVDTNAYTTMDMIDASMYGGSVNFGFGGTDSTDPAQFPQWGDAASNPAPVYLTFSGGGHALQFLSLIHISEPTRPY